MLDLVVSQPVFQAYIVAVIVLSLNLVGLANATALSRAKAKEAVNPEDLKLPPNAGAEVVYYDGNALTQRYRRAHGNALENVPLFVVTGFLLTLTSVSLIPAAVLFGIFTLFRILHSISYVKAIQPLRTASFAIAALTQVTLLGFLGYYAFAA